MRRKQSPGKILSGLGILRQKAGEKGLETAEVVTARENQD